MLIITCDPATSVESTEFTAALSEVGALQITANTWLLPGAHLASAVMDMLEPLLPDRERDALFIAALDVMAELQWANTTASDAEIGSLIRNARENPTT
jgi:hypothetical protein